jgi:hypothetical protein
MAHSANSFAVQNLWKAGRSHTPLYPPTVAASPWPSDPLSATHRRFRAPGLRSPWGPARPSAARRVLRGLYVERPPPHVPAPTPPACSNKVFPHGRLRCAPIAPDACPSPSSPPPLSDSPHQDTRRTSVASLRRLLNSSLPPPPPWITARVARCWPVAL